MSPNAAILGDPRVRQSISCKGKGALLLVSQDESRRSLNYVKITSHTYFEQNCVSGLIFNRNKEQLELPSAAWQNQRLKLNLRKKIIYLNSQHSWRYKGRLYDKYPCCYCERMHFISGLCPRNHSVIQNKGPVCSTKKWIKGYWTIVIRYA